VMCSNALWRAVLSVRVLKKTWEGLSAVQMLPCGFCEWRDRWNRAKEEAYVDIHPRRNTSLHRLAQILTLLRYHGRHKYHSQNFDMVLIR
jgi:hypothetical protein